MINHTLIQLVAEQAMRRSGDIDEALVEYLEGLRRERSRPPLRSRLAGLFVGCALRLDPQAVTSAGGLRVHLARYD